MELLERDKRRALLHERLAFAEHGHGQIVFLGGEAGTEAQLLGEAPIAIDLSGGVPIEVPGDLSTASACAA